MNREDFIKIINGELWYKSDYTYWLYKQLEERETKIDDLKLELESTYSHLKEYTRRVLRTINYININNLLDDYQEIINILEGRDERKREDNQEV